MTFFLFLSLLAVPLIEIALFVTVGGAIGLLPTLALVVFTAVLGTHLLRLQGLKTWLQARKTMDRGEMPVRELFHGLCIFAAGIVLLTPGFFTDAIGFLLLIPFVRTFLAEQLARHVVVVGQASRQEPEQPVVIDADFVEIDPDQGPDR